MLRVISALLLAVFCTTALAEDKPDYQPQIAPASNEGELGIQRMRVPEGMKVSLVAAEPLLANPVAFCIDEQGRIFVAETFRQQKGVEDNRGHMTWLDDDLALQTVEQRLAMFRKHLKEKVEEYTREHDRIRLLQDADGDGVYEKATVFAGGFNSIVEGTGAGLLARRGNVYYTCIPKLWLFRDEDGDGRADVKKPLHHGYGVRVAFRGHDLHGLRFGPDGKLYYSIGDRGYHVEHEGKVFARPETGAVFRCNPDGSELEVFATGLRNPQELAFDQHGNLFTCDNNSDSGDQARWTYILEGSDTGWRMYYQYLNDRGPWNREKLWHPQHPEQPAYIVPTIINLSNGPSGLTFYPGVGLPERYQDHFFLADFRGGAGNSGIRSFAVQPKGATFELTDSHEFLWSVLATDVEFGYDGGLYVSDWVDGWNGPGKGRIYKLTDPKEVTRPEVSETRRLFAEGFTQRKPAELVKLLAHADQRVRQEAQFALADAGAIAELAGVLKTSAELLPRLHAVWGLGQIGRKQTAALEPVAEQLASPDAEVRSQALKVLGDDRYAAAHDEVAKLLADAEPRVQGFAAAALAKIGKKTDVPGLFKLLEQNADADPALRHQAVMGLAGIGDDEVLEKAARHASPAVRIGALLALRYKKRPELTAFLNDAEPRVLDEAVRAIHDLPLVEQFPAVAALASRGVLSESTWRRVINANFRIGGSQEAQAVAVIAGRSDLPDVVRIEAVNALSDWGTPSNRDRVLGDWRPIEPRSADAAKEAFPAALGGVFSGSDSLRQVGAQAAAKLGVKEVGPALAALVQDKMRPAPVRVEAGAALVTLKDPRVKEVAQTALVDAHPLVRAQGRRMIAAIDPESALALLTEVLANGEVVERQQAYDTLAALKSPEADAVLKTQVEKLLADDVPAPVRLDLVDAAAQRPGNDLKALLEKYQSSDTSADPLHPFRDTLVGGDVERGRAIFFERASVSCVRCHQIDGRGGEVGPNLSKLAVEKKRDYLLESLVLPNKQIAKGFETVVLVTNDGKVHVGIVKEQANGNITLLTAEGKTDVVPIAEIDERAAGKSSMPEDLVTKLTKRDIRDLVEFLSTLKGTAAP